MCSSLCDLWLLSCPCVCVYRRREGRGGRGSRARGRGADDTDRVRQQLVLNTYPHPEATPPPTITITRRFWPHYTTHVSLNPGFPHAAPHNPFHLDLFYLLVALAQAGGMRCTTPHPSFAETP